MNFMCVKADKYVWKHSYPTQKQAHTQNYHQVYEMCAPAYFSLAIVCM